MSQATKAPIYRTLQSLPTPKGMPTGTQMDNVYDYIITENLIKGLEKTGEINRYEKIQKSAEECKIETILAKAAVDPSILQNRKGMFLDTSEAPKSLAEFENMRIKVIQEFGKLPIDIRKKFDNSPEKFVAEYGSEEWADKMGLKELEEVKEAVEAITETSLEAETEGGEVNE